MPRVAGGFPTSWCAWFKAGKAVELINPSAQVTGTPGTGKSSLCEELATRTGLKHTDVSALAIERSGSPSPLPARPCLILAAVR
jgi:hypothetical protein